MFSFQIRISAHEEREEEEPSTAESSTRPDDVKAKLQEVLHLLNRDIRQLV